MNPEAAERRLLTNVAYRMLGTVTEAEDAVQEAYARWYAAQRPGRSGLADGLAGHHGQPDLPGHSALGARPA